MATVKNGPTIRRCLVAFSTCVENGSWVGETKENYKMQCLFLPNLGRLFDISRKLLSLRKGCTYIMVKTPTISVIGGAWPCYPDGSCNVYFEMNIYQSKIAITKDAVTLNGIVVPIYTVSYAIPGCMLQNDDDLLVIHCKSEDDKGGLLCMSDKSKKFFAFLLSSFSRTLNS